MQELKETTYEKTDTRKNTEEPSEVKMPCIRKPLRFMFCFLNLRPLNIVALVQLICMYTLF